MAFPGLARAHTRAVAGALVVFFASWCHPCRVEFPLLGDARARYADRDLEVIGIVYRDIAGDARGFAQVAQRCGVNVVPGQVLSAEGDHREWLRLAFVGEPSVIEEAVRRLAVAWELYAGAGAAPPREPMANVIG